MAPLWLSTQSHGARRAAFTRAAPADTRAGKGLERLTGTGEVICRLGLGVKLDCGGDYAC
jgi:hypothetical protein